MKRLVLVVAGMLVLSLFIHPTLTVAQHSHGGGMTGGSMKMETKDVLVEGVKVTFQIMANRNTRRCLKT